MCKIFMSNIHKTVAGCHSSGLLPLDIPPGDPTATAQQTDGFTAKETDIWADPAVTNRGYDSR
jgi:hypothetical protein